MRKRKYGGDKELIEDNLTRKSVVNHVKYAKKGDIILPEAKERQEAEEFKDWEGLANEAVNELEPEETEEGDEEITVVPTETHVEEPHKPTVGDLLARLHITNIQKEVVEHGSAGCTEPNNPQGDNESRE